MMRIAPGSDETLLRRFIAFRKVAFVIYSSIAAYSYYSIFFQWFYSRPGMAVELVLLAAMLVAAFVNLRYNLRIQRLGIQIPAGFFRNRAQKAAVVCTAAVVAAVPFVIGLF